MLALAHISPQHINALAQYPGSRAPVSLISLLYATTARSRLGHEDASNTHNADMTLFLVWAIQRSRLHHPATPSLQMICGPCTHSEARFRKRQTYSATCNSHFGRLPAIVVVCAAVGIGDEARTAPPVSFSASQQELYLRVLHTRVLQTSRFLPLLIANKAAQS
ncbi:hypothetical protein K491DRAFT_279290 [Lophiostoma macrostomum CBS 122681]|uniref:Uncharacterized protein n=1 Tax=Lophiostoma macrostomum CBS 122681 TaxID=1314788 RepID=A0A6A6SN45_9PLEO|nr:hypothetical protein K491DRAFT_279290 [Lophiostoma macrostomum CBS 122681]